MVGAPGAVAVLVFQVAAPGGVLNVEAVGGGGGGNLPVGVHVVQGGAGIGSAHGQLLALGGGEGVAAVLVDAHGPDVSLGVAGQLAVGEGHIGAGVIEAGVVGGQGLHVGGVKDHHGVTIVEFRDDAFLPDLGDHIEGLGKQGFAVADVIVSAPGAVGVLVFQVAVPGGIFNVVAALSGGVGNFPVGVHIVQGGAGIGSAHGQLLALSSGEGVAAVVVDAHGPDVGLGVAGQDAVSQGHVGAGVIEAGIVGGQGLQVGRVVDDHLVAVLQQGFRGGLGIGLRGGVLYHQIQLLGKERLAVTDGTVSAPGAVAGLILQIAPPDTVLDVEAVGGGGGGNLPGGVHIVQGGAGIGRAHGQLLSFRSGEGIGAVLLDAQGPQLGVGIARQNTVGQGHGGAVVVETVIAGGQGLQVGGIEDHQGVAVPQGGQIGDQTTGARRLGGGTAFQLVQREVGGVTGGIAADGAGLIAPELVLRALVAGQNHGIFSLARELEGAVGAGHVPAVVAGEDTVGVAALGGDGHAIAVGQLGGGAVHRQGPDLVGGGIGYFPVSGGHGLRQNPAAVHNRGGVAGFHHQDILTGRQLIHGSDLGVGGSVLGQRDGGNQGQYHGQHQQPGEHSAQHCVLHKNLLCELPGYLGPGTQSRMISS